MTDLRKAAEAALAADSAPLVTVLGHCNSRKQVPSDGAVNARLNFREAANPAAILALLDALAAERTAREKAEAELKAARFLVKRGMEELTKSNSHRSAAEASLSASQEEVKRLRDLLPAAEGILTWCEQRPKVHAYDTFMALKAAVAKAKEAEALKETPHEQRS